MACSTVLTAGAAAGAVVLSPGPVAAQQTDAIGSASVATAGAAATQSSTTPQATLGQSLAAFEARRVKAQAAAALRASRARTAAAHARSARARAARLAAQHRAVGGGQPATPLAAPQPSGSPQHIAMAMLGSFGWPSSQFGCLDQLWSAESGWNPEAANASGAYGIPQALPGSKMASAGPDWQTDAATQIKWGLGYIKGIYESPCGAWGHEEAEGWY